MLTVFRNPALRFLLRLWWVPVLAGLGLGGEEWLRLSLRYTALYFSFIAGLAGLAWAHYAFAAARASLKRKRSGHRFLCPSCLSFGPHLFACGACKKQVTPFIVQTAGAYVDECPNPNCHERLFDDGESKGAGLLAYCRHCEGTYGREQHHGRRVRVLAALRSDDFASLYTAAGLQPEKTKSDPCYAYRDDGELLTYLIDFGSFDGRNDHVPPNHALRAVRNIWVDEEGVSPLTPVDAANGFTLRLGLTDEQRRAMNFCVRQAESNRNMQTWLKTWFGRVEHGVTPEVFLGVTAKHADKQLPSALDTAFTPEAATCGAAMNEAEAYVGARGDGAVRDSARTTAT